MPCRATGGSELELVNEYRKRAEECRFLAEHTALLEQKRIIFSLAETWDELANKLEETLKNHPKQAESAPLPWRE